MKMRSCLFKTNKIAFSYFYNRFAVSDLFKKNFKKVETNCLKIIMSFAFSINFRIFECTQFFIHLLFLNLWRPNYVEDERNKLIFARDKRRTQTSLKESANTPRRANLPLWLHRGPYHRGSFLVLIGEPQVVLVSQQEKIFWYNHRRSHTALNLLQNPHTALDQEGMSSTRESAASFTHFRTRAWSVSERCGNSRGPSGTERSRLALDAASTCSCESRLCLPHTCWTSDRFPGEKAPALFRRWRRLRR